MYVNRDQPLLWMTWSTRGATYWGACVDVPSTGVPSGDGSSDLRLVRGRDAVISVSTLERPRDPRGRELDDASLADRSPRADARSSPRSVAVSSYSPASRVRCSTKLATDRAERSLQISGRNRAFWVSEFWMFMGMPPP